MIAGGLSALTPLPFPLPLLPLYSLSLLLAYPPPSPNLGLRSLSLCCSRLLLLDIIFSFWPLTYAVGSNRGELLLPTRLAPAGGR